MLTGSGSAMAQDREIHGKIILSRRVVEPLRFPERRALCPEIHVTFSLTPAIVHVSSTNQALRNLQALDLAAIAPTPTPSIDPSSSPRAHLSSWACLSSLFCPTPSWLPYADPIPQPWHNRLNRCHLDVLHNWRWTHSCEISQQRRQADATVCG
jgi:hypothetical protein